MKFIHASDAKPGIHDLSARIIDSLKKGSKTLWLICGGSNIIPAVEVMKIVRKAVTVDEIKNLTVSQTDERYGPIGHPDSNWKQMIDAGFDFDGIQTLSILRGLTLDETVKAFGIDILKAFDENEIIIGFFGIGPDGHIAGTIPHSPAVNESGPTSGYEAGKFTRISITPKLFIERLTVAYAMAFGETKAEAIHNLLDSDLTLDQEPAQLLKSLPEAYLYSDCQ